jgi:peptide-methionine (S)-S-oxide reductase
MKTSEIIDPDFRQAVEAIDAGEVTKLKAFVGTNPQLVKDKLINWEEGYFKDPYLLYFIADNPIRNDKLPANILEMTGFLIGQIKQDAPGSFHQQINYTLGLVATGRIPAESGLQPQLIDLLIDAGASPGEGLGALAHGNKAAAAHLIKRGGKINLGTAVGLDYSKEDISGLALHATEDEKLTALTVAAFYGNSEMVSFLLSKGFNPNGYPAAGSGFHSHATPLHQAVSSGSLETVKLLADAGADLDIRDKIYGGSSIGWAHHMQMESPDQEGKKKYEKIEEYLLRRK